SVGAVDYLEKPVDADIVRAKVAVFVDLQRKTEQVRRQAALLQESERRERERALEDLKRQSERRYMNLADAVPEVVFTASARGEAEYWNRRWSELTGLSRERSAGSGWIEAVHPDDVVRALEG